ncbi:MAG: serine hydrolase [Bacillota bacterium]
MQHLGCNWDNLATTVREVAARLEGNLSVRVADPLVEGAWGWRAEERCPSASVIKILIAWEAYRQAEAGMLGLDESARVPPDGVVGGTGVLHLLSPGVSLAWRDLVALMLAVSDNTATNLLIDRLGFDAINATARALGLAQTVLQRKMMDFGARAAGRDNFMSATDAARLLGLLARGAQGAPNGAPRDRRGEGTAAARAAADRRGEGTAAARAAGNRQISAASCRELLAVLEKQQFNHKLPSLLPGVRCAHKTGELPGLEHDAGVVYLADGRPLVVAVFTWDLKRNSDGVRAIAEVARAAYEACTAPTCCG